MFYQTQVVNLEDLVPATHQYRKFKEVFDFNIFNEVLNSVDTSKTYTGFGSKKLFLCSLLQFMEDLSDRELEEYLQSNLSAKWFCEFDLSDNTPNFSVFSRYRSKLGTKKLSLLFSQLKEQLVSAGYISEVFTFVDASHLISKANLWRERDEVIKQKYDSLNNQNISKVSRDPQAKIGCKGGSKFWYGYKKHVSVDMQSGLINKVAVTPANITDEQGLAHVCPKQGAVYMDKGYCGQKAENIVQKKGAVCRAIKKNNMKSKNRDFDKWLSGIRSPYERVFSHSSHKIRFIGIAKNQFSEFMKAIGFNLKRLAVLAT